MAPSAQGPSSQESTGYIDVARTSLQKRFFSTFEFDSTDELLAAVAGMQIDLATIARSRDFERGYSGWLYWLIYLKGYLQYAESGMIGSPNIYFDYLMNYYIPRAQKGGLLRQLADPQMVVERVARRFRDVDFFRKHVGEDQSWLNEVAPVRIIASDPPPDNPLLIYEVGSDTLLKARLIDGWHRLFSARLFGVQKLRYEVNKEDRQLNHIRGNIEHFSFDGRRLVIRGWCIKADRQIHAVEVRVGGRTIARGDTTNRSDVKDLFEKIPHAERSGFAIDCDCYLPTDEFICFKVLPLNNWLPVGAMVACYLPGMYNERNWPPTTLAQRLVNESEPQKLAFKSIKYLHEMLLPLQRHRSLGSFTSVLDWGSGCGLLEFFLPHFLPEANLIGIEVDKEAVEWCKQSGLPGEFRAVDHVPPTDLPSDSFDLVLSYSALTHLSRDAQMAWLGEMHRVTKSGGYLVVGVYGELIQPFLTSPEVLNELASSGISDATPNSGSDGVGKAGRARTTYQTKAYTLREYSKWFEIVDYVEGGVNDLLDLVVMRKV